ncbi:MAG: hypothetical protein J6W64_06795 [Bacilli bacterium]|nr:hypothetical protein [Bacilli bacterium]
MKVDNLALVLQALSLEILFKDYNNSDLMQELQRQDSEYLEKMLKQNELIIKLLQERSDTDAGKIREENRRKYKEDTR